MCYYVAFSWKYLQQLDGFHFCLWCTFVWCMHSAACIRCPPVSTLDPSKCWLQLDCLTPVVMTILPTHTRAHTHAHFHILVRRSPRVQTRPHKSPLGPTSIVACQFSVPTKMSKHVHLHTHTHRHLSLIVFVRTFIDINAFLTSKFDYYNKCQTITLT